MKCERPLPESAAVLVGCKHLCFQSVCTWYMLHSAQSRSPFRLPDTAVSPPELWGHFWQRAPVLVCAAHLLGGAHWGPYSRAHTMHGVVHDLIAPCCSNCQQQQARGVWGMPAMQLLHSALCFGCMACTDSRVHAALRARPAWSDTVSPCLQPQPNFQAVAAGCAARLVCSTMSSTVIDTTYPHMPSGSAGLLLPLSRNILHLKEKAHCPADTPLLSTLQAGGL